MLPTVARFLRASLDDDFDPRDADSGSREATPGSVGATPVQPYGPPISEAGPETTYTIQDGRIEPPTPSGQWTPVQVIPNPQRPSTMDPGQWIAEDSQSQAPVRAAQPAEPDQVSRYVPSYAPQAGQTPREPRPPLPQGDPVVDALAEAGRAGVNAFTETALRPPSVTDALTSPFPDPIVGQGIRASQAAQAAAGDVIGRRVYEATGGNPDDELIEVYIPGYGAVKVTKGDVAGLVGQVVTDPSNLVGTGEAASAAGVATRAAQPAVREGMEAAGRVARGLADDAARGANRGAREVSEDAESVMRAADAAPSRVLAPEPAPQAAAASFEDFTRAANSPERAATLDAAIEEARQRWQQGLPPRDENEQLLVEQFGRRWSDIPPHEQPAPSRQAIGEAARGQERVTPDDLAATSAMPDYRPQSISLNAQPGVGASAGLVNDLGNSVGGGVFGAAAGAAMPAETDEERRRNALTGAGIGMVAGPAAGRLLPRAEGALATLGATPNGPRRRLRTLPDGAQAITATDAAEVSRLRLDKFPEDVRDLIAAGAKEQDWARTQRRGVLPDDVVQQMAADDAASVDSIIKQGKAGRAYNAEETVALRNAVASQADAVRQLSDEIATARANNVTPDLLIARRAAEATRLNALVQIAEGARAEAGRTLRQYRQQARLIDLDPNQAVQQIYRRLGGRDNAEAAIDEYTKLVQDGANPIQLAKFWARVESGQIKGADLFALYRRFNMLSGPRTLEVNALSGGVNLGYEVASQALGQVARARLAEAGAEFAAPFKAMGRAFTNMAETMYHGVSLEQAARGDIPRNLSSRTDNKVAKAALTVLEIPDRFNAGVDQFFRTMTEDWAATILAHRQAREAGVRPSAKTWAETVAKNLEAIRDDPSKFPQIKEMADHVTFSEEPGGLGRGLEALRRQSPVVMNIVAPFIRTPYNIASRAVDMSPLGIVRTGIEAATGRGRSTKDISRRLRDNAVGLGATYWAYQAAKDGNLTGAGPDDPEKIAALRATGWQPYSVKIGNQYWSYANFAPFSLALSTGAAIHEAQKYAKDGKTDALSMLADGAERTAKVVTDMTVLAGIGAVVKSIQDPDRYGGRWLSQFLQTLIPAGSLVNTVGQMTDPTMRRAERDTFANQVQGDLMARVPGLREQVPAAQDPLGRPVPNEQTGAGALNPFRPTTERPDVTLQTFIDAKVDIGKPRETISLRPGTPQIPLTPAEQRRWNELRGEQLQQVAPQVARAVSYQQAGKAGQEAVLKRLLNIAGNAADAKLVQEIGEGEIRRRLTEAIQKKAG